MSNETIKTVTVTVSLAEILAALNAAKDKYGRQIVAKLWTSQEKNLIRIYLSNAPGFLSITPDGKIQNELSKQRMDMERIVCGLVGLSVNFTDTITVVGLPV